MDSNITPIVLIGFMGTGKTTLGQYMAKSNNFSFVDLDHYIVQQEHQTIPEIFDSIGEQGFRQLEAKYLKDCLSQYNIISTGGGIVEGDESHQLLKNVSNVIWLDCDINILYERIKNDQNRPNANNKTLSSLKDLYLTRVSRYNEIAFMKVISDMALNELQTIIIERLTCD
jgi:shikimate kinase